MSRQFVIEKLIVEMEFGTEAEFHTFARQPSREWLEKLEGILQKLFIDYEDNYELDELILDVGMLSGKNAPELTMDYLLERTRPKVTMGSPSVPRFAAPLNSRAGAVRTSSQRAPAVHVHSLHTYLWSGQFIATAEWSYEQLLEYFTEEEQRQSTLHWIGQLPRTKARLAWQRVLCYLPPAQVQELSNNVREATRWQAAIAKQYLSIQSTYGKREDQDESAFEKDLKSSESRASISEGPVVESTEKEQYIGFAGLVIVAPYLPALFDRLGLLDAGKQAFRDEAGVHYAIHVAAFLASGKTLSSDHNSGLLKVLCGKSVQSPVVIPMELSDDDISEAEYFLLQVTKSWEAGFGENINLLRGSFLFRNGKLTLDNNDWELKVEAKVYDEFLLTKLKWGFRSVQLPWMRYFLRTIWG